MFFINFFTGFFCYHFMECMLVLKHGYTHGYTHTYMIVIGQDQLDTIILLSILTHRQTKHTNWHTCILTHRQMQADTQTDAGWQDRCRLTDRQMQADTQTDKGNTCHNQWIYWKRNGRHDNYAGWMCHLHHKWDACLWSKRICHFTIWEEEHTENKNP